MADGAEIVARARGYGANIVLKDGELRLINGRKLPPEAAGYIKANSAAIRNFLGDETGAKAERAAIIEFEGKTPRQWAEAFAELLFTTRPPGIDDADWTWFLTACGRIIDEAPRPSAA